MFSNVKTAGTRAVLTLSACALVYLVAAGQAAAADPQAEDCQGLGKGVKKFAVKLMPNTAGTSPVLLASALLCGNDIIASNWNKSKGFLSGSVILPSATSKNGFARSIITRCANPANPNACTSEPDLKEGQYVGRVGMGVVLLSSLLKNLQTKIYVNKAPGSPKASDTCSAKAIACYQAEDSLGDFYANIEVINQVKGEVDAKTGQKLTNDRYTLVINKIKLKPKLSSLPFKKVYYARIGYSGQPVDICKYAGAVNGDKCGTKATDWVQKNGPVSHSSCDVGEWLFDWLSGSSSIIFNGSGIYGKSSTYKGTGFIAWVDDTEVKGANDWWGTDPQLIGPDGKTNFDFLKKQYVYVNGKATLPIPFCAPLEIV